MLLIVNPSNGPGDAPDSIYQAMIGRVSAAGIPMLGYTWSHWGARPIADIAEDIRRYRAWYPQIKGYWIDEMAAEPGFESDYSFIKEAANCFVGGNPGMPASSYEGILDLLCIFEGQTLPSEGSFHGGEAWVAYGVPFDASYLNTDASYFYMTDWNDWFHISSYLSQLL